MAYKSNAEDDFEYPFRKLSPYELYPETRKLYYTMDGLQGELDVIAHKVQWMEELKKTIGDDADEDIAHVHGVSVAKGIDEKDPDVGMYLQESVYVPKSVTV